MKCKLRSLASAVLALLVLLPGAAPVVTALEEDITKQVEQTGLPVIAIDVNDGSAITDRENYKDAMMYIGLNDSYSEYTNNYTSASGAALTIKGRGNSSWTQFATQKRSYNIKLDKKTALFGMDKSKKWCLIANFMDRSNLRNKLAYELSGRLGLTYCESVFVNFYLNGNYMGVYQLCERADADEEIYEWDDVAEDAASAIKKATGLGKADAAELEDAMTTDLEWITSDSVTFKSKTYKVSDYYDYSGYSLNGGYLIEYDYYFDQISKFHTGTGVPLNLQSPEYLNTNPTMMSYLQTLFEDFEEAIYSESFYNSKGHHYSEYVDMKSLVDFYIVNALFLNVEFGYKSTYLYIDGTGIITFGPVWDFDWSSGNHFLGSSAAYDKWYGGDWRESCNTWYQQIYGDPYFVNLVRERWFEVSDIIAETVSSIDTYYTQLAPAADLEQSVYLNLKGENDYRSRYQGYSFSDECNSLKSFLTNRINWMNTKLKSQNPDIEGFGAGIDSRMKLTLSSKTADIKKASAGSYVADYTVEGMAADKITLDFSINSTGGVSNAFEIYVNGSFVSTISGQSGSAVISAGSLVNGINTITAVRVREGVYYGTCNFITVNADISGVKVQTVVPKLTPAEVKFTERSTLISSGGEWKCLVTTADGFSSVNESGWKSASFDDYAWITASAPFGDRISNRAETIGWTGKNHVLFLRRCFTVDDVKSLSGSELYFDFYYDNTVYIYINGTLVYSDDTAVTGKNDWTDSYETVKLDGDVVRGCLNNGENIITVSIQDTAGGREFELGMIADTPAEGVYVNPEIYKQPEATVLKSDGEAVAAFVTARDNASDGAYHDAQIILLINRTALSKLQDAEISVAFTADTGNKSYRCAIKDTGVYESLAADKTVFETEEGFCLCGYIIRSIPDGGWSKMSVTVEQNGALLMSSELTYEALAYYYSIA